jgi:hypothetical protein
MLQDYLAEARAGKVESLAIVARYDGSTLHSRWNCRPGDVQETIGLLVTLMHDLLAARA